MVDIRKDLLLTEKERPGWFEYPRPFLFVVEEAGIHRLDPWEFLLGDYLRYVCELVRRLYPGRELVPFAEWEDLVACWDKEKSGRIVMMDVANSSFSGVDAGNFWEWFTDAVQQMIARHYDG
jgi:hypothetical protein